MKFSYKLLLIFGLTTLILGLFFSFYTYFNNKATLEKEIMDKLEGHVKDELIKIDIMIYERKANIRDIATNEIISSRNSTPEDITNELMRYRNNYKAYASLSFFDLNRIRIADTTMTKIGEQNELEKYFEEASKGELSIASDVKHSSSLNMPIIYFASPVKDKSGEIFGVVVARMPISKIYDILGEDIEEYGELDVDLLNKDGMYLFSSHRREVVLKETFSGWNEINKIIKNNLAGSTTTNINGEERIVVFAKEEGYLDYAGNDWILIMQVPAKIAFAPTDKFLRITVILFIIFLFLFLLSFYFSQEKY